MHAATPPQRVRVLVNPRAGTGGGAAALREGFGGLARIEEIEPAALRAALDGAVAAGDPVVGVAGGDGTMHTAAAALVDTHTALLPIPTGTLNHFARRHGIESIAAAAAALRAGRVRRVAVGTLDGRYFLNTLTFGEYSRMLRMRERMRRYTGKWVAAFLAGIATLATLRRFTVRLEVDGRVLTRRTPIVWIGLGYGSFPRVHDALEQRTSPDLEVTMSRAMSRPAAIGLVARLSRRMLRAGTPLRDARLEVLHTRRLTLIAGPAPDARAGGVRIDATADGELMRVALPVTIGVSDGALRVIGGEERPGSRS
ncbi:MAG TPA: diacylglycerol kinase family protein [Longimicrobiales bacterium]